LKQSLKSKLFFDSSVIISASLSSKGGSYKIIRLCFEDNFHIKRFVPVLSRAVLFEVETNLFSRYYEALARFHDMIGNNPWIISELPSRKNILKYSKIIDEKDAHILASAMENDCRYLLTLDKKHFKNQSIEKAGLPFRILTPGEFLNQSEV
jgi:predicted nucleic acid-binding protein